MKFVIIILGMLAISLQSIASTNCEVLASFINANKANILKALNLKSKDVQMANAQASLRSHMAHAEKGVTGEYACGDLITAVTEDVNRIVKIYSSKAH